MARVVHFEIHADDPERAADFYRGVFGWQVQRGAVEYWLCTTGEDSDAGINGAIMRRQGPRPEGDAPVNGACNIIQVVDLEESANRAVAAGGLQVVPRMEIPGVGSVAYFKDTENNVFGVIQPPGEDSAAG